ncbi:MAG: translocated intimin receptor Tir [Acidobacteria bacterium]|nr:translocated intimin receptor Tir [Acidobacteriota bacterium]
MRTSDTVKAILTDSHFWIPVAVLVFGVTMLVVLHNR